MRLGAMNNPKLDPVAEVRRIAAAGFDFVDLTLEPPRAAAADVDVAALHQVVRDSGLEVVGHTAWFLPIASPFASVWQAALREIERALDVFARLGATRMNVHPDARAPMQSEEWIIARNAEALSVFAAKARPYGITVMVENTPGLFSVPRVLQALLAAAPDVAFHLDVAHAHISGSLQALLEGLASRLVHVHVSDNGGRTDDHLPLGAGTVDWARAIGLLKQAGYDDTVTLEIFSTDLQYLYLSRDKFLRWWGSPSGSGPQGDAAE